MDGNLVSRSAWKKMVTAVWFVHGERNQPRLVAGGKADLPRSQVKKTFSFHERERTLNRWESVERTVEMFWILFCLHWEDRRIFCRVALFDICP